MEAVIIDGYVDEPAHHGAPPYISTYPRYIAGAMKDSGIPETSLTYFTIDQIRSNNKLYEKAVKADLLVVVTGMAVPVSSVGGEYMTLEEMEKISKRSEGVSIIGGPVRFGVFHGGGEVSKEIPESFDFRAVDGDVETAVYDLVTNSFEGFQERRRKPKELERWAKKGSFIVEQHPNHPEYIMAEVKIGRGCNFNCSFCVEPLYGKPRFRKPEEVVEEVEMLNKHGINDFRLQAPNFLTYGGDGVKPSPVSMRKLYKGINSSVENLGTLHLDNFNAKTISNFPEKSRECLDIISRYNTPGDTCSIGLESADKKVQRENNLSITNEECMEALETINEAGNFRVNDGRSLPKLLPGLNFVFGLKGQTEDTFRKNYEFLKEVYDKGLLLRRINLRQVSSHPGTGMEDFGDRLVREHKSLFKKWKKKIREEIDRPMLKRVAPKGTVIKNVFAEFHDGKKTFARPLGSYPLLVGINSKYEIGERFDIAVTDYGYRSITGVKHPLNVNNASLSELKNVPGIGSKRAGRLIIKRPFETTEELEKQVEDKSMKYVSLSS